MASKTFLFLCHSCSLLPDLHLDLAQHQNHATAKKRLFQLVKDDSDFQIRLNKTKGSLFGINFRQGSIQTIVQKWLSSDFAAH